MSNSLGAVVIPGVGTVYFGPFRASGAWGTLEAEKGVLVASDGRSRRLPAPVRARRRVRSPETDGRSRRRRAGSFAKEHGGATTKSSGSSHERHSLAFVGRAARSRRVRLFSDGTRNRRCPGTRASALGHDGCGVRAPHRSNGVAR